MIGIENKLELANELLEINKRIDSIFETPKKLNEKAYTDLEYIKEKYSRLINKNSITTKINNNSKLSETGFRVIELLDYVKKKELEE